MYCSKKVGLENHKLFKDSQTPGLCPAGYMVCYLCACSLIIQCCGCRCTSGAFSCAAFICMGPPPYNPADSQAVLLPDVFGLRDTPFKHVSTAGARGLTMGSVKMIHRLSGLLTFSVVPVKPVTCLYMRAACINHEGDSRNPVWVWRKYFGLVGLFASG